MSRLRKPKWDLHHLRHNPEHDFFMGVIVEYTDISGIECFYYIRDESVPKDWLYGESDRTRYLEPKKTRLIYEPTEESTLTTGFGINSEEVIQFASIPKLTFSRDVSGGGYHPKPGDAIITLWNDRAYEIADVGEEEKIFQLKKMVWGFVLRPYRFSEESESAERISRFNRLPSPHLNTDRDVGTSHPHNTTIPHTDTGTLTTPLTAYGDNEEIEEESEEIFDYDKNIDIDTSIYGY